MKTNKKANKVKQYLELVARDASVRQKLKERLEAYKGDASDTVEITKLVILPTAKELGYSFTADEYLEYVNNYSKNKELSEGELDLVVGGVGDVTVENTEGDVNITDQHTEYNYYFVFPAASDEALAALNK